MYQQTLDKLIEKRGSLDNQIKHVLTSYTKTHFELLSKTNPHNLYTFHSCGGSYAATIQSHNEHHPSKFNPKCFEQWNKINPSNLPSFTLKAKDGHVIVT